MKSKNHLSEPEFMHVLFIDKIPAAGIDVVLAASEVQCKALARRFDLVNVTKLSANLNVSSARAGEAFAVSGTMISEVVQTCVVTLEPIIGHIKRDINVMFAPEEDLNDIELTSQSEMDTEDVEPIKNGQIDLGELVAQHLGISLDPYPRKPGVDFPGAEFGVSKASVNPFAKLIELKNKPKK